MLADIKGPHLDFFGGPQQPFTRHGFVGSYNLDAETNSVNNIFIMQGDLKSNVQNRHPFHHQPRLSLNCCENIK